jgi:protein-disulfide isomerase
MPRRNRSYSRQQAASKHLLRNIFIVAAVVVVAIVGIAVVARPSVAPNEVAFPARELGAQTAMVVVEEFADFQCPGCGYFGTHIEARLREEYVATGKVRFIFRNFPIVDGHTANGSESHLAALAALCAGDQDMFWEYHDFLYKNQSGENEGAFSSPRLEAFAAQLHLDSVKFDQCLGNQTHLDVLNGDIRLANFYKLNGTPSFFVNGRQVNINPQDTQFQELFDAIDKALQS